MITSWNFKFIIIVLFHIHYLVAAASTVFTTAIEIDETIQYFRYICVLGDIISIL